MIFNEIKRLQELLINYDNFTNSHINTGGPYALHTFSTIGKLWTQLNEMNQSLEIEMVPIPSSATFTSMNEIAEEYITDIPSLIGSGHFMCGNFTALQNIHSVELSSRYDDDTYGMFYQCYSLINVPNFNTTNVTNMGWTFGHCHSLTNIPNLDTSNAINMYGMFDHCENLSTIPLLNTANARNMCYMFSGCGQLTTVPEFNSSKVINMQDMFWGCSALSNASLSNVINMCINVDMVNYIGGHDLSNLGLTYEQGKICENLPRWPEASAKGWEFVY